MKKFTAALMIFMFICSFVISDGVKKAYAIVPALGPAVYYGLGSLIVATGVYAGTNDDLQYLVEDYWQQASDRIKNLWKNTAIYAGTAGYLIVNQSLISDITDYLINEKGLHSGTNVLRNNIGEVPITINPSTIYQVEEININGYPLVYEFIFDNYDPNVYNKYQYTRYLKINGIILYEARSLSPNPRESVETQVKIANGHLKLNYISYDTVTNQYIQGYFNGAQDVSFQKIKDALGLTDLEFNEFITTLYEYFGNSEGIGTALEPEYELKVPCPPVPEVDWPETWLDDLEKALNETDNPAIDDETTIDEGNYEWDWYVDEYGNIYKVKKGQQPNNPETDRKIGWPLPINEPNIPDDFPDINNPEETTIENPPEITSTQNPDGTRTDTTTQTTTTTRRWYDPDTEKWKQTTTTTTTTTEQDYDPDGLPIGPPRTVITTPEGPIITTPPEKDADKIDWEPLKIGIGAITNKFPFSLPWDIYNSFSQFAGTAWNGEFEINIDTILADWVFTIDFSMWENIISIVKKVELMFFDIGLILATRRLMGGGV